MHDDVPLTRDGELAEDRVGGVARPEVVLLLEVEVLPLRGPALPEHHPLVVLLGHALDLGQARADHSALLKTE